MVQKKGRFIDYNIDVLLKIFLIIVVNLLTQNDFKLKLKTQQNELMSGIKNLESLKKYSK